jgi:hypothetical protein
MAEPESILQLGIEAARDGNKEEARSLFRLLTRQEPRNAQAWLWLAGVAETRDERQAALEHVVDIEPTNDMAIKGLQALGVRPGSRTAVAPTPAPAAPVAPAAPASSPYNDFDDDDPFAELDALADVMADGPAAARRDPPPDTGQFDTSDDDGLDSLSSTERPTISTSSTTSRTTSTRPTTTFSTSNRGSSSSRPSPRGDDDSSASPQRVSPIALGLGALLLIGILFAGFLLLNQIFGGSQQASNPTVPSATTPEPGLGPTDDPLVGTGVVSPTAELPTEPPEQPTEVVPPTPEPPAGDPALSAIPAIVPPNTPLDSNGWAYNFSQPNYATSIIGALNGIQPQGRFVVVLVLVSNTTGQGQVVPGDFFVLKDGQGRVYNSQPNVSTAYVIPGVNADLSQEQAIPADGASYSVALLFDVAPDATNLVFFARSKPDQGWQVLSAV